MIQFELIWWWLILPPALWYLWKKGSTSQIPLSPWGFLCHPQTEFITASKTSKVQLWSFVTGAAGLTLVVLLLSRPYHISQPLVLVRETDLLKQCLMADLDLQMQLSKHRGESNEPWLWTDHRGNVFHRLSDLLAQKPKAESWIRPQRFLDHLGPKFIWSPMAYHLDVEPTASFPIPEHLIPIQILGWLHPAQWLTSIEPTNVEFKVELGSFSKTIPTKNHRSDAAFIGSAKEPKPESFFCPWTEKTHVFRSSSDPQGTFRLHLPPSPQQQLSLDLQNGIHIPPSLAKAIQGFKSFQPQQLRIQNSSIHELNTGTSQQWLNRITRFNADSPSFYTNTWNLPSPKNEGHLRHLPIGMPRHAQINRSNAIQRNGHLGSQTGTTMGHHFEFNAQLRALEILHHPYNLYLKPWPQKYIDIRALNHGGQNTSAFQYQSQHPNGEPFTTFQHLVGSHGFPLIVQSPHALMFSYSLEHMPDPDLRAAWWLHLLKHSFPQEQPSWKRIKNKSTRTHPLAEQWKGHLKGTIIPFFSTSTRAILHLMAIICMALCLWFRKANIT
jgi:hypothetical protein